MLYFPERIARGDVPNVDFLHLYGPGSLHVLTGWYEVFGHSLPAERTFGLLQHLGIIFGLFALARAWGRLAATAVAAACGVLRADPDRAHGDGLERRRRPDALERRVRRARAVPGRRPSPSAGVADRRPPRRARPDVPARSRRGRRAPRRLAARGRIPRCGARSCSAPSSGCVPMWYHLVVAGPRASFEGMFVDPVFRLRAGRELPRPPSWSRIDGALQAIAEEIPPWWRLPHLGVSHALFLWFFAMLLGTAVAARLRRRRAPPARRRHCPLDRGAGGRPDQPGNPPAGPPAPRLDAPDVGDVRVVAVLDRRRRRHRAAAPAPRRLARRRRRRCRRRPAADDHVHGAVHVPLLPAAHPRRGSGRFPAPVPVVARRADVLLRQCPRRRAPCSRPSTTSTPWRSPASACSSGRRTCGARGTATRSSTGCSPSWSRRRTTWRWIPASPTPRARRWPTTSPRADWLLLTGIWDGWVEPNTSMEFGSDAPNEVIREQFCEAGSYEDALVVLYRRCRP